MRDGLIENMEERDHQSSLNVEHFQAIKTRLYDVAGITLADHKRQMVENRITKRIKDVGLSSFGDYVAYLEGESGRAELVNLVNALTTNVTHFFREGHHFDHLAKESAQIIQQNAGQNKIRIWSAGCSIGAEPYSAAISLYEMMRKIKRTADIKLLATDIDTVALAKARTGVFNERITKGLSRPCLENHFTAGQEDGERAYRVKPHIRNMVAFNYLNFNDPAWPMSGPFDFIFCRNALIYFDRVKQGEYVGKMAALLKPGGYLYLGHSEHAVMEGRGFTVCGQTIYQKPGAHTL